MHDPKKNIEQPNEIEKSKKLALTDEELRLLEEGELAEVSGGIIGFPPCAAN